MRQSRLDGLGQPICLHRLSSFMFASGNNALDATQAPSFFSKLDPLRFYLASNC